MKIMQACRNMLILAHPHPFINNMMHLNIIGDGTMVNNNDEIAWKIVATASKV